MTAIAPISASGFSQPIAFYRELRAAQEAARADRQALLGDLAIPSSINPTEAAEYWNYLTKGRVLDIRI